MMTFLMDNFYLKIIKFTNDLFYSLENESKKWKIGNHSISTWSTWQFGRSIILFHLVIGLFINILLYFTRHHFEPRLLAY